MDNTSSIPLEENTDDAFYIACLILKDTGQVIRGIRAIVMVVLGCVDMSISIMNGLVGSIMPAASNYWKAVGYR